MAGEHLEGVDDMVAALNKGKRRRYWRGLLALLGGAAGILLVWALIEPSPCDQLATDLCESANIDVALCEPYVELLHALEPSQDACEAAVARGDKATVSTRNQVLHQSLKEIVRDALDAHAKLDEPLDEELELVAKKLGARP